MTACASSAHALGIRSHHRKSSSSSPPSSDFPGPDETRSPSDMVPDRRDADWTLRNGHRLSPCHRHSGQLLTLPTILTLGRVAAVPLLVCTTSSIFLLAAVTDWLDGYLARKMNLGSAFGAFLDPVADKLMVAATLVLLCTRPLDLGMFKKVPWLLPVPAIAIIGREITMSAVREWAASQGSRFSEAVAVNSLGKWKTATQMTALTILLIARDSSLTGSGIFIAFGVFLLYISAWLAVWSLIVYMGKIWRVLQN
uniref:CDP-diacylglycerol--glycerol-3-phosphate 1-phosphatidyltransferase n=1 Tax=Kalanchoe fedtschenkoi TaxID=63787 RepID=A0A7N0TM17_KALFE